MSNSLGYGQTRKSNRFDATKVNEQIVKLSTTDELLASIESIEIEPDSISFFQGLKNETTGFIQLGYSYGLNTTFRDSSQMIGSIFNTQGAVSTQIMKLPIKVSYNYTTLRVPLGANNYFRISYDKEKFEKNNAKLVEEQKRKLGEIDKLLTKNSGELSELQSYLEVYLNAYKEKYLNELKAATEARIQLEQEKLTHRVDSFQQSKRDSLSAFVDSTQQVADVNYTYTPQLAKAQAEYEKIQGIYDKIMALQQQYDQVRSTYESANQLLKGKQKLAVNTTNALHPQINQSSLLSAVKKVDLGLTYPASTALSTQSTAVKGIGTEFQFNNIYLAASSGITLNNVMLSTNDFNNQLIYNQNAFNQFDFQHVVENGILSIAKGGYGTPGGTHAFIGVNHLTNSRLLGNNSGNLHPAMGIELDVRYQPRFLKGAAVDFVYAKTSINRNIDSSNVSMVNSLFSSYKSNSYLVRYTQDLRKLRSNFPFHFVTSTSVSTQCFTVSCNPAIEGYNLKVNTKSTRLFVSAHITNSKKAFILPTQSNSIQLEHRLQEPIPTTSPITSISTTSTV